ncbi:MAG: stage V sporulation protein AC [Clostridia bacterium]|nr:stage V sporulation protein AC [Clostridia bacterium]
MNVSKKEYQQMCKVAAPGSPVAKDCLKAFAVGGFICTLGEVVFQLLSRAGTEEKDARTVVSAALILLAAILTACKVFDNIAKHAGAGTLVPITGFANSVVAPAIEFKTEGYVLGVGAKAFIIAGPVIVYGTVAAVLYGVIYWVTTLF